MTGVLLAAGLSAVALGGALAAFRRAFSTGLLVQAVGATGVSIAGFWALGSQSVLGDPFANSFTPRVGVDGLSGLFLGVLGLIAAPTLVFSARYVRPTANGRAVGALTALLTAVYMTRLMVMTFFGKERFNDTAHHSNGHDDHHSSGDAHDNHDSHHGGKPHETPRMMTIPLIVLAIGAVFAGFLGMPSAFGVKNYFEHFLEPSIASVESARQASASVRREAEPDQAPKRADRTSLPTTLRDDQDFPPRDKSGSRGWRTVY